MTDQHTCVGQSTWCNHMCGTLPSRLLFCRPIDATLVWLHPTAFQSMKLISILTSVVTLYIFASFHSLYSAPLLPWTSLPRTRSTGVGCLLASGTSKLAVSVWYPHSKEPVVPMWSTIPGGRGRCRWLLGTPVPIESLTRPL
jgi:hypothetical protein